LKKDANECCDINSLVGLNPLLCLKNEIHQNSFIWKFPFSRTGGSSEAIAQSPFEDGPAFSNECGWLNGYVYLESRSLYNDFAQIFLKPQMESIFEKKKLSPMGFLIFEKNILIALCVVTVIYL